MGGSQASRIGKRNRIQAENQAKRREASLFLRTYGMTPEQYRLAQELKAKGMDREPSQEQTARMTPEERAAWAGWQEQRKQGQSTGLTKIQITEKKRPEERP